MSRSTGFVIGAAFVALLGTPAQAAVRIERAAPLSQQLTATTATQAFPRMSGMSDLGRISDRQPMHIVVSIPMRNKSLVDTILRRQVTPGDSLYGHFLTPEETRATFSPSGSTLDSVATYLARQGFVNIHATPDNQLVTADGNAGIASRAFSTEIHAFRGSLGSMYANVRPVTVPLALRGSVLAVLGLHNATMHSFLRYAPHRSVAAKTSPVPSITPEPCNGTVVGSDCIANEYDAQQFRTAYDVAPNVNGSNHGTNTGAKTSIAIFTEGDMTSVLSDLKLYEKANNLQPITPLIIHPGIASPDTSGADEFDLDTQSSTGIAQVVKNLYLYNVTSLTDADTAVGFSRFQTDDLAKAGSASFGECEILPELDGALTTDDEIFARAAVQGQTVFASSGDNGSGCPVVASTGTPASGPPMVSYPASSPYVIGVGGTSLIASATAGAPPAEELGWIGSGGGISTEESAPFWQDNVVSAACVTPSAVPAVETMRCVPDIAMDADNELSPAIVYVGGASEGVGGTSLASPLSLGSWAMIETHQSTANKLGFAGPLLYAMYKKYTTPNALGQYTAPTVAPPATQLLGGLLDITTGSNGMYAASTGYDNVTGLGSLDIQLATKDIPADYTHGP